VALIDVVYGHSDGEQIVKNSADKIYFSSVPWNWLHNVTN